MQKHHNPGLYTSLVRDRSLIENRTIARWNGPGYWRGETLRWPSGRWRKNIGWPAGTLDGPLVAIYTARTPDIELSIRPNWLECYCPQTPLLDCPRCALHCKSNHCIGEHINSLHIATYATHIKLNCIIVSLFSTVKCSVLLYSVESLVAWCGVCLLDGG